MVTALVYMELNPFVSVLKQFIDFIYDFFLQSVFSFILVVARSYYFPILLQQQFSWKYNGKLVSFHFFLRSCLKITITDGRCVLI